MAEEGAGLDGGGSKKQRFSLSDYKNKRGTSAGTGASSEAKRDEKFETKAELDDIHQILRGKGMENEEEEEIEREGRMRERPQTPNSNSIEGDWGQGTEMMDVEERGGEEMDELNEERDDNYMAEGSGGWGEDEKREEWVLDTSGDPEQERYDNVSRADSNEGNGSRSITRGKDRSRSRNGSRSRSRDRGRSRSVDRNRSRGRGRDRNNREREENNEGETQRNRRGNRESSGQRKKRKNSSASPTRDRRSSGQGTGEGAKRGKYGGQAKEEEGKTITIRCVFPYQDGGIIIGTKGSHLVKLRRAAPDVDLQISSNTGDRQDRLFVVKGSSEDVSEAFGELGKHFLTQNAYTNFSGAAADQQRPSDYDDSEPLVAIRLLIPHRTCGAIIGQRSETLAAIRAKSRSRYINVYHKFFHDSRERVVEIIGTPASLRKAVLQICRRIEGFLTQDQRDTPLYSPKRNGLREFLLNQGASERSINLVYTNKQTPMAADSHSSASYHNSSSNQNQTSYSERRSSDRHTSAALPSTSSARNSSYQNQNRSSPTHYSPPPHNSSSSWSNAH